MLNSDSVIRFIERLTLTDDYSGQPFRLREWQKDIIRNLYREPYPRRSFIFLPRKSSKTTLLAGVCLAQLTLGGEGQQLYSIATTRKQAGYLCDKMAQMILTDSTLRRMFKIVQSKKLIEYKNSFYQGLSADHAQAFGTNPSMVISDEVAQYPNRFLFDAMTSGMVARKSPRVIAITSAHTYDPESLVNELYQYAKKVRDGIVVDPDFYSCIYELGVEDDWRDEANWHKVMPALGDFVSIDEIRKEYKLACEIPAEETKFRTYYLNTFLNKSNSFLKMEYYDKCQEEPCYEGPAVAALDLSSVTDLTALCLMFADYSVKCWAWCPKDTVKDRVNKQKTRYDTWIKHGFIETTNGNVIDYDHIKDRILQICTEYEVQEIAIDRWNSHQITQQLIAEGLKITPYGQGYSGYNSPMKELVSLVMQGKLKHGNNPVLRYSMSNLVCDMDAAGNLKPNKAQASDTIDMACALLMALGLYQVNPPAESVYMTTGV